jgi:hypothetical protein
MVIQESNSGFSVAFIGHTKWLDITSLYERTQNHGCCSVPMQLIVNQLVRKEV